MFLNKIASAPIDKYADGQIILFKANSICYVSRRIRMTRRRVTEHMPSIYINDHAAGNKYTKYNFS